MSKEQESEAPDDREPLVETLRRRWYFVLAALIVLLLACLFCANTAQTPEAVAGFFEEFFGGNGDPADPPPVDEDLPEEDDPPPVDDPTPTDEPTEVTEEVAQGDGACNAICNPDAPNCLAGLSCLPVPGQGFSVCWNDTICQPETNENPPPGSGNPTCGDGTCDTSESPATCPADCGLCGNGVCDPGEHVYNCSVDCGEPPPPGPVCTCNCIRRDARGQCIAGQDSCTGAACLP